MKRLSIILCFLLSTSMVGQLLPYNPANYLDGANPGSYIWPLPQYFGDTVIFDKPIYANGVWLGTGGSSSTYDGSRPLYFDPSSLNGKVPGTTTIDDFLDYVFYSGIAPVADAKLSYSATTYPDLLTTEVFSGSTKAATIIWTITRPPGGSSIASANINGSSLSIGTISEGQTKTGNFPIAWKGQDTTFTLSVTTASGITVTEDVSIAHLWKVYWGWTSDTAINSAGILALSNSQLSSTYTKSAFSTGTPPSSATTGDHFVYAFPESFGSVVALLIGGFPATETFVLSTITHTNSGGALSDYHVYISRQKWKTNTSITVQ